MNCPGGACMAGGCMHGWGHAWQGCVARGSMTGRGHALQGRHVWWGRGEPAWQERWPLQRAVRILLERILVFPKIVHLKSVVIHPRELLLGYH